MSKTKQKPTIKKDLTKSKNEFPVVGVGASAGGLNAFKELLKAIPKKSGMAFVLVQHLHPEHESVLSELLQKVTKIPVVEITDDMTVEPDHIYIIPSNKMLLSNDGKLELFDRPAPKKSMLNLPINLFFTSLAEVHQAHSIGVVLSGTGSDGTLGLKAISGHGGITFAQDEKSAQYNGMPTSATEAGVVDFILPPHEMPQKLLEVTKVMNGKKDDNEEVSLKDEEVYKQILSVLRVRKNTDFTYYKQTTIRRRILRRMALNKKEDPKAYLDFLRKNKEEQDSLYQDLLIPVTGFFRDSKIFDHLCETVFPKIVESKNKKDSIRIWSAGCSTGQEAYSMAMCLKEFMGNYSIAGSGEEKVQIFASDISEPAIAKARKGEYSKNEIEAVSEQRLKEFFVKSNGKYQVKKEIREMCVFAVHNFLKDPPFGNLDFISCRNVLIYMEPYLQKKALTTFHYALNARSDENSGRTNKFLLLGKSETCSGVQNLFAVAKKKDKLFTCKNVPAKFSHVVEQTPLAGQYSGMDGEQNFGRLQTISTKENKRTDFEKTADELILKKYTPSGVVVNESMEIVHFRGSTTKYLEQHPGKPSHNLLKMAKDGLGFELRNLIHKAKKQQAPVSKNNIPLQTNEIKELITIEVVPLPHLEEPHYLIIFQPDSNHGKNSTTLENVGKIDKKGNEKKAKSDQKDLRIKQLENELAQAREDMRGILEEQEAANEELQSANEELLSGNEELQSLNEEVETSQEELQSTNEELTVVNQELINLNGQLTSAKKYAEAIVETIREPLLILDKNLRVVSANKNFYKTFKVEEGETEGKLVYEIGNKQWNTPELKRLLVNVIPERESFKDFEVTHDFKIIGTRTMLLNAKRIVIGKEEGDLILLAIEDVTERKEMEEALRRSEKRFREMINALPAAVYTTDAEGMITHYNPAAVEFAGRTPELGKDHWCVTWKLYNPDGTPLPHNECPMAVALKEGRPVPGMEAIAERPDGTRRWFTPFPTPLRNDEGRITGGINMLVDITEQKEAAKKIEDSELRYQEMIYSSPSLIATFAGEDMVIEIANDAILESWDKGKDIIGKSLFSVMPEIMEQGFDKILKDVYETGEPFKAYEMPVELLQDGKMKLIYYNFTYYPQRDANEEIFGVVVIATEATPQAEFNKKLKESESHFKQMADLMPEKVLNTDEKGNAYYFNQCWLDDTGKTHEELEGRGWQKMIHPDDFETFISAWKDSLKTGKEFEMQFRCLSKNGRYEWHLGRATAVKNQAGEIKTWINSAIEIQHLKEEEKRKEDFLKMVSHELKTPVTSIKGYVQLLLSMLKNVKNDQLTKLPLIPPLERIDSQLGRLTRLISEMLDLSRLENNKLDFDDSTFTLKELVDNTVQDINYTHSDHKIKIKHEFECSIKADKDRIGQVLINFITNAIKYSPNNQQVEVRVHDSQKDYVTVSVKDHGIGIAKKDQKKIFERFYRVDGDNQETYAGFGIGLYLSFEIIQRHGGTITVESKKGEGSIFSFSLPCGE